jgi:hypothetical protein
MRRNFGRAMYVEILFIDRDGVDHDDNSNNNNDNNDL